jgi:hypothetical protein
MAMAQHAAEHGLIARQALADVQGESGDEPQVGPIREVEAPGARSTREAVQQGALADALEQGDGATPASVEVEAEKVGDKGRGRGAPP